MGFFKKRRVVREGWQTCKTVRVLMRKHEGKLDAKARTQLARELATLKIELASRDVAGIERASAALNLSLNRHLAFAKKSILREYAEAFIFALILALIIRTFIIQLFKIPTGSMEPTLHGAANHRGFGDHIVVNKFIYGPQTLDWIGIPWTNWGWDIPTVRFSRLAMRLPKRGDIVVFRFPFDYYCRDCHADFNIARAGGRACMHCGSRNVEYQNKDFVKRCVGLPGETIEIRDGHIYADGTLVTSPKEVAGIRYVNIPPGQGDRYGLPGQRFTVPKNSYFMLGDNSANSKDSRFWGFVPFENVRGLAFFVYLPPSRIGVVK